MTTYTSLAVNLCEGLAEPGVVRMNVRHLHGSDFENSAGTFNLYNVPAGCFVKSIRTRIHGGAWISSTAGALTLNFGDTADDDGFLGTTLVVPGTTVGTSVGTFKDGLDTSMISVQAYNKGKLYSEADTINLLIAGGTVEAAINSSAEMDVIIEYVYPLDITT